MERLSPPHQSSWRWWLCGLLLFASAINYMDRQTLANASVRITSQFHLSQEQYGNLELAFGWAFAAGSLVFGILVDRFPVRWVYPAAFLLWSLTGYATGWVRNYSELMICRTLLGCFEAGHWPCAIKTTQHLLSPRDRALGNSVLQSGTSIGAVAAPLLMRALMTDDLDTWRFPFKAIGLVGLVWILCWFALVRRHDLQRRSFNPEVEPGFVAPANLGPATASAANRGPGKTGAGPGILRVLMSRRMLVVLCVVACINTAWQLLRAWLPKLLIEGRGYSESYALYFTSLFYVASDLGCLGAGALVFWLARAGLRLHASRLLVFLACAALAALTTVAARLPQGWPLVICLLLVGAGALGVFPIYHALTQDLSNEHQGKVTGIAGVAAWAFSPAQSFFGRLVDRTGSFDWGLTVAGWLPLAAFLALWLFWGKDQLGNSEAPCLPPSSMQRRPA